MFDFSKIAKLKKYLRLSVAILFLSTEYWLVKNSLSKPKKRYALPGKDTYGNNCTVLLLCNIHKKDKIDKGITSFFIWKFLYFTFFEKSIIYLN